MILRTKLYAPPVRPDLTPRPRLLAHLRDGLAAHRKLTLVSAPAGYGKTTLVTAWLADLGENPAPNAADGLQTAWLSLDADDNDPARFVTYWIAALQSADPALGKAAEEMLAMSPLPPLDAVMGELLNSLLARRLPLVLVLDDYHTIHNPQVHELLAYFIEHQPGPIHLVLTTRDDPPLPLARLRARGQLTEIRAEELRFTLEEAHTFLEDAMGLDLDTDAIATLETRTEGWAAGLQLAALALQRTPQRHDFVKNFGGSHRYIIDYLAEEVIRQQEEATRRFLTRTSILSRLCGPLCDALLDREDGDGHPPSATVLQKLEQANLFLIPLDGQRQWYRYHHLFADYLRLGLEEAERVALCKRAAGWHEANGMQHEAVRYALQSEDAGFAADVIARTLREAATWSAGNLRQWLMWLDALPAHVFSERPRLSLDASRALYLSGRFDEAEALLTDAEDALNSLSASPERDEQLALGRLYRGALAAVRNEAERAIELITAAQPHLPSGNRLVHARAHFGLGMAYDALGRPATAVESYLRATEEAQAADVHYLAIHGLCAAAQVRIKQGKLRQADQHCRAAVALTEGARLPPLGLAWSIRGGIALERNDLDNAEKLLEDGIALSRQGGLLDDVSVGLAYLARLRAYQGDRDAAREIVSEATTILRAYDVPHLTVLAGAHRARLHLILGETAQAEAWETEVRPMLDVVSDDMVDLTLARILPATGRHDTVPGRVHPLVEKATAAGRMQTVIEGLVLLALAYDAQGKRAIARRQLEQALKLAAPEGYTRVFLDMGTALLPLLAAARTAAPDFVDGLLDAPTLMEEARAAQPAELPEPLTDQELNVLDLLVAGKTNQEIADALTITIGTAKWHVHNVLQKLDVSNRTQATARAHELGLTEP